MYRQIVILAVLAMALAGASQKSTPVSSDREPADFELNFAGVCAADWPSSFRFYTEALGIRTRSRRGNWALLGSGWDRYLAGRSRGLVFELFERGRRSSDVDAEEQAIRLGIQVRDLEKSMAIASARGVHFASPIQAEGNIRRVEFMTPERIQWILWSASGARPADDFSEPDITLAEIRVQDLRGQIAFYRDVLGMRIQGRQTSRIVLRQAPDGPQVVLKPGGRKHVVDPIEMHEPAISQPVFLSFMTRNVRGAWAQLRDAGALMLQSIKHHDWGGTDLVVADADGNAVQVVEYDVPHAYGSQGQAATSSKVGR